MAPTNQHPDEPRGHEPQPRLGVAEPGRRLQGIAVRPETHQRLSALKFLLVARLARVGWKPTQALIVDYLVNYFDCTTQAIKQFEAGEITESHLRQVCAEALAYTPPTPQRVKYGDGRNHARNATIEHRALVAERLARAMGITDPSDELINALLDNGALRDGERIEKYRATQEVNELERQRELMQQDAAMADQLRNQTA